jgi:hypothetical protein
VQKKTYNKVANWRFSQKNGILFQVGIKQVVLFQFRNIILGLYG